MKWFKEVKNLEDLRRLYKSLVVRHHPDNGGMEETIKEINVEYDILFKQLKENYQNSEHYEQTTEKQRQAYDSAKDQKLREMIVKLCRYPGLIIELCGVWIWVSGSTITYKEELKKLGLRYASAKKCWYIHFDDFVKHGKKPSSMSYIRDKYGSMVIHSEEKKHIART